MFSMTTTVGVIAAFPPTYRPVYKYMCVCRRVCVCVWLPIHQGDLST